MRLTRIFPILLLCAAGAGGCTTTASRELALAVRNYEARSLEAIAAVETIEAKAVEQPAESTTALERKFVRDMLDPALRLDGSVRDVAGDPIDPQTLVAGRVHPYATTVAGQRSIPALDEMRCVHGSFAAAFADLEGAGFLGKRAVSQQAPPLVARLVAQQMLIARLVQGPLRADMRAHKAALIAELDRIRAGAGSEEQKRDALLAVRARWLAIEDEERQLTQAALESLLKAAATGVQLHKQFEQYGQWSLSDVIDSANGLTQFIASVSGKDMTALNGRIEEIRGEIANDPDLARTVDTLLASVEVPARGGVAGAAPPAAALAPRGGTGPTPCLDGSAAAGL